MVLQLKQPQRFCVYLARPMAKSTIVIGGQLQHRGEIGYQANRKWLVKVRDTVLSAAIADGWGNTIDQRVFE